MKTGKHHGKTIERVIRVHQISISELARLLNVDRRSIYNWFDKPHLRSEIIFKIGYAIKYDFSKEFPELFSDDEFRSVFEKNRLNPQTALKATEKFNEQYWKSKYHELLQKVHKFAVHPPKK
ncbi:hypothetical protein SAMN05660226_00656 [Parapedobacter luteus]|uniref:HTH cro/C1-type domain-containing protein n=1 Tax=Parapedobacter luteus TaxID=623280 RepID=A0A1T5A7W4_9SPHI|nr:hypothetical protein [Parapedobacter luteus]SKB30743.1 hypothetical protein SAMN05660226_00656 [Parapedobacter luteus]